MTRPHNTKAVSGPLLRAGAAFAVALALLVGATACTPAQDPVVTEVEAMYSHSRGVDEESADARRDRDAAILEWAAERGILEADFTAASLESAYEDDGAAETEYGARDAGLWAFYQDFIEEQSQAIRDEIRDEQSIDDVRTYYEEHPDRFENQDALTIEVTEWEDGRATSTYAVDIDAGNVRELHEHDDLMISAALNLAQDEQATVDRGDGRFAQLVCTTRKDAGVVPFDDVVQAAAAQLAADLFETQLRARLGH